MEDVRGLTRAMVLVVVLAGSAAMISVDRLSHRGAPVWACDGMRAVYAGRLLHGYARDAARVRARYRGPVVIRGSVDVVGDVLVIQQARLARGVGVCCAGWRVEGDRILCTQAPPPPSP